MPGVSINDDERRQHASVPILDATLPRSALLEKLETCSPVKPLLMTGALVEARADSLTITADNLAILCRATVPATVEHEGSVVFSAQRLAKLLDNADGDEVALSAKDEKSIAVTCGGLSSTLACSPAADFPRRPTWPVAATFEIPNIRGALAWLSPVLNDDGREKGIHFVGDGQTLRIEAIDGRQMHCLTLESSAIVNAIAPASLIKFEKVFDADGACTVEMTERTISLISGETFIQAQLLEGNFPDTARIIPPASDKVFVLRKVGLEHALSAASAVLEKNTGPRHVNVSVKPNSTTISTARCAAGLVEVAIEVPNSFEIDFQVDPLRLLNALKPVDGDQVTIQGDDPLRSVCVRHGEKIAIIATMHVP